MISIFDDIDINELRWRDGKPLEFEVIGDMKFLKRGNKLYYLWRESEVVR